MIFRLLQKTDFQKGFIQLLSQLTNTGDITQEQFELQFENICSNKYHYIYVVEDDNKIIACATLLIEPKFIHHCGLIGHIEDVVIDKDCRGKKLGKQMIDFLTYESEKVGCYKIILDCSDYNTGFYNKCSFQKKGAYMAKYF